VTARFDAARIREILPHGDGWRLLQSAEFDDGAARSHVRLSGWGARLAVPHLYLVEALTQLSGLALAADPADPADPARAPATGYLAALEGFKLGAAPPPGAIVDLESRLASRFGPVARFDVVARAGGVEILHGSLTISTR
jgi:hypothetical protein